MSKLQADGLRNISVVFLNQQRYFCVSRRSGSIRWTRNGSDELIGEADLEVSTVDSDKYLHIRYSKTDQNTGKEKDCEQKIYLTTTPCHYGNRRYWFLCHCGRRVGVLYLGGNLFACRHCYKLTYASRNESRKYRRFVSIADLRKMEAEMKRTYYRGVYTKKHSRYLDTVYRFNHAPGNFFRWPI